VYVPGEPAICGSGIAVERELRQDGRNHDRRGAGQQLSACKFSHA